jgi:hypothetical protein
MQMKKYFSTVLWMGLGLCHFGTTALLGTQPEPMAAQYHFVGAATLASGTNLAKLKQVCVLPETSRLREVIVQRLADAFTSESAQLIQPLLEDLIQAESAGAWNGQTNPPGFTLAIKLNSQRAQLWQDNLAQLLAGRKYGAPSKIKVEGFAGQTWKKDHKQLVQFFRAQDWVLVGCGEDMMPLQMDLQSIAKRGRPVAALDTNFFQADINWAQVQSHGPLDSLPLKLARTVIAISSKADDVKVTARLIYPEALQWKPQPWRIPIDTLRDPLVSFTAGQNLSLLLKETKQFAGLGIHPLANQIFSWAHEDLPFQTFLAIPTENATKVFDDLSVKLPARFNADLKATDNGELRLMAAAKSKVATVRQKLIWQGLPIIVPEMRAIREKAGEFLFLATFPMAPRTNAVPAELIAQVDHRTNLVYYDWELTGPRLQQWRMLSELLPLFPKMSARSHGPANKTASANKPTTSKRNALIVQERWFTAVAPLLGNTATEITRTGPNELTFVRKSQLGLTGLELVLLGHWLTQSTPQQIYHPAPPPQAPVASPGKTPKKP